MALYKEKNPSWRGGFSRTKLYRVWNSMRGRCDNPNDAAFAHYGKRGIKVCPEWSDYNRFHKDMSSTYRHGLWIERIDNDKGYSKDNCRWDTPKKQMRNRRNTRMVSFNGTNATLSEWSEKIGIKKSTLSMRFYVYKWPIERVLTK